MIPDRYFYDTSALTKRYVIEPGSNVVDELIDTATAANIISRLAALEVHSALAKRVRAGQLSVADYRTASRRFRAEIVSRPLTVMRVLVARFHAAEELVVQHGLVQNLRTLDALQLAVALKLNKKHPLTFVCADQALCAIAADEGLAVINPERP